MTDPRAPIRFLGQVCCLLALVYTVSAASLPRSLRRVASHSPPAAATSYDVPYSVTADVPYTNSIKDAAGRTITVSSVHHLTDSGVTHIEIAEPLPPPPPPGPTLLRVESAGAAVSAAPGGVPLELVGTGFPLAGIRRLSVAGQIATVTQWTATRVSFTLPAVTQSVTGPVEVWVQPQTTWVSLVRGLNFTITPRAVPPPPPPPPTVGEEPVVDQVLAADGQPHDTVTAGDPITLVGRHFGAARGQLFVCGFAVVPISWADARIVFRFSGTNRAHRIWAMILRADGEHSIVGGGSESRPLMPFVVAGAD